MIAGIQKSEKFPYKRYSKLNKNELRCIRSLIDMFQDDGAKWTINDINLNQLKDKLL